LTILGPCGAGALLALFAVNALRPTSASEIPASAMNRPIKTRRLKKADFEADFFFMELVELRLYSTLRHPNAARYFQLFSQFAENVSTLFRLDLIENFSGSELVRINGTAMY
jgi:hypothetical protein